ncbi:Y-family DNA polymerase [Aliamphritea hakodatensis]|uniref:Y-family DNA polymerase n=1 Tax=Aliamphritea hakodatensis TaxID=2895352 RepID=UPI0022FD5160|nr:Y-family DNA polymerase [Aliamphritea hakodatensis]
MYALCDANSMYASCEKIFDPSIRDKPVVVLTNNDGCICAACHIAKRLGIDKKFVPYFKVKEDLERAGAVIRSSNYELYADISQRMMDVCSRYAPNSHIYSIDEVFHDYQGWMPPEGWFKHAWAIRRAVWQEVRLPIGVGIGPTLTLAKAANHAAKRIPGYRGVAVIDDETSRRYVLQNMELTDVWGIGSRLARRLQALGVDTVWKLANANPGWIRKNFSVLVEGTVYELSGIAKLGWDDVRAPKKEIYSIRSFGQRIFTPADLLQALTQHAGIAAAKLRRQNSLAGTAIIFATSSPHDARGYYRKYITHRFAVPTQDTTVIANACRQAVQAIYRPGVPFYRCGVGLIDLSEKAAFQHDLFTPSADNPELMACMDAINVKYGRDTAHIAGQGIRQKFAMRRQFLSPQYTTRLSDIPRVKC